VNRRTAAELDRLMQELGTDLELGFVGPAGWWEDADLRSSRAAGGTPRRNDLAVASKVRAAEQLLVNRLMTHRGELAPLGHPEYGSRHHDLIGQPNVARTRNLIKLYVLEALRAEPRIAEIVSCKVYAPHDPPRDQVRIDLVVRLIDHPNPLNLVVPFSLETSP
jgi:phage baseplate assembly protein W